MIYMCAAGVIVVSPRVSVEVNVWVQFIIVHSADCVFAAKASMHSMR
jgi:hypothetical protein